MVRGKTQKGSGNASPVKNETYMDALRRDYVFFYSKLKGLEVPMEKRFVEPAQEEEVRRLLLAAKQRGMDQDDIIRTLFHADPATFQQELSDWEEYKPSGLLNKGTPYERRAFPIAKSVNRFIATIRNIPKHLQYKSDFMVNICESSNFTELVRSLRSRYCVSVLTLPMREQYEENRGSGYAISYIIVKPEFFPPRVTVAGGPITLNAERIPTTSFLLDAFQQNGIVEIEPTLYTTLQKEVPELLRFSLQEPVVLLTPAVLTNATATKDRYILMSEDALPRGRNVINMRNIPSKASLKKAFETKRIYVMDPRTMYEIRRNLPALWEANYGTADQAVFRTLTPHEQLVFCFLQSKKYEELYSLSPIANALTHAKRTVFEGGDPYELADTVTLEDEENLRQLVKLQQSVFRSVAIRTPDDIRSLLRKFDPSAQQTDAAQPESPVYPPEILAQRKPLLEAYQTALRAPVSTSRIPSMFRTRKATNANREQWKHRVRTAKAALLQFNRTHKLPFSKWAEQYNL